ncbi:RusA family crossover junction endodeoxyribonuclease [Vibrio fortis]|uniref:RusA family crossover junction endodeoxyribonuclease n=1 Tax=Vibrio fortis TaxID=212667 RepID=A0A5N3QTY5_9VIBR|nr:RusA family crossover junction endodeoxyribonuclease [Vibrio fortis]KAB0285648.1 RusA family crossover junction endodeoxyribonuclease [Vibrio fortis]
MHLGRKVDSAKYRKWSAQVCRMLPPPEQLDIDFEKPIAIHVAATFRNRLSDLDNIWKPLLDAMQKAYPKFNDNKVVQMSAAKYVTKDDDDVGYLIRLGNCSEDY